MTTFLRYGWLCLAIACGGAAAQTIDTVMGGGVGDGGPALQGQLRFPRALAFDGTGDLFIADGDNRIRKIDVYGTITTIAGTGNLFVGGGTCLYELDSPSSLAIGADGSVFVAEDGASCIVRIAPDGQQSIVAGNGYPGNSPDGAIAATSPIDGARAVALGADGTLYFLEYNNLRKIDAAGRLQTIMRNVASAPQGLAIGSDGAFYVGDTYQHIVVKIAADGQSSSRFAGGFTSGYAGDGGPATAALLNDPVDLHFDASGNLYIVDASASVIRKVDSAGTITTVAGNGNYAFSLDGSDATASSLYTPYAVAFDKNGSLYFAEGSLVRRIDAAHAIRTVAGGTAYSDGTAGAMASLSGPQSVAADAAGNVYVADSDNNRVRRIDSAGRTSLVAGNGAPLAYGDEGAAIAAGVSYPTAVAIDRHTASVYIASGYGNATLRRVDTNGLIHAFAGGAGNGCQFGSNAANASFGVITALSVAVDGTLYVLDTGCNVVDRIDAAGTVTRVAGTGVNGFAGDGGPATSALLNQPGGLAVDASGDVYIADSSNDRIRKVMPDGTINTIAGNSYDGFGGDGGLASASTLCIPQALALDASGTLFIADQSNARIRAITPDGIINTVAGDGSAGFFGDGGPAVSAEFNRMAGLTSVGGQLYVADYWNQRIRRITFDRIFRGGFE